ncbi:hypothetical protein [Polyangium jinanense]|uniref:Uncharacterized protein n=1 Tax=Polyangium jinanense TaxID=2829994 RepID=A0A9X3XFE1_9BACT|nr:hypothetical protein [Polyangium jinanense]MDC3961385.1 hypothetical protein [Polyangium jinanense]MDC3986986.1 hypothetical protein [Polyangium jinanense]
MQHTLPLRARITGGLLCAGALALTVHWVATGTGPYAVFLAAKLGENPAQHPLAAAGLTFIVTEVPALVLMFVLAAYMLRREGREPREMVDAARAEIRAAMDDNHADPESLRAARNFGIAAGGGVAGAVIRAGWLEDWFGDPDALAPAIVVAALFGLVAGLVHGRTALARLGFCIALVAVSLGSLPAVAWYLERRPAPLTIELLLPIFVGGLPGALLFWGVTFLVRRAR